MHINYNLWGTYRTGGNRVILEFAKGLCKLGHKISITLMYLKKQELNFFYSDKNIEVIPVKKIRPSRVLNYLTKSFFKKRYNNSLYDIYSQFDYRLLASNIPDCDINIATYYPTAMSVFCSNKGIPVYHVQHWEPYIVYNTFDKLEAEASYYLPLHKMVNSSWLQRIFKEKFNQSPPIITPGIDMHIFRKVIERKDDSIKKILAYVSPAPHKGFQDLINALQILKREGKHDIELICYGSHDIRINMFQNLDNIKVTFYYKVSDKFLAKLYSVADIVVFPSWIESSPLPPMEAMACGTAVITTRPGTEDFAVHEINSLVIEPHKPEEIANSIKRLLEDEDLINRIRKNALKTAEEKFQWTAIIKKMENLLIKFKNSN